MEELTPGIQFDLEIFKNCSGQGIDVLVSHVGVLRRRCLILLK